jgi:hypothetical protein
MPAHSPHLLFRLRQRGQGDLALLLRLGCTNDTLVGREVVLVVLLCIAWSRIRFVRVPCSKTC